MPIEDTLQRPIPYEDILVIDNFPYHRYYGNKDLMPYAIAVPNICEKAYNRHEAEFAVFMKWFGKEPVDIAAEEYFGVYRGEQETAARNISLKLKGGNSVNVTLFNIKTLEELVRNYPPALFAVAYHEILHGRWDFSESYAYMILPKFYDYMAQKSFGAERVEYLALKRITELLYKEYLKHPYEAQIQAIAAIDLELAKPGISAEYRMHLLRMMQAIQKNAGKKNGKPGHSEGKGKQKPGPQKANSKGKGKNEKTAKKGASGGKKK